MAKQLAEGLSKIKGVIIDSLTVFTNIIFFKINDSSKCVKGLISHLLSKKIHFKAINSEGFYRIVTHHYIRQKEVDLILEEFKNYFSD